jgi:hypothetical protein
MPLVRMRGKHFRNNEKIITPSRVIGEEKAQPRCSPFFRFLGD